MISREAWCGWFSMAVGLGDLREAIGLYEARPNGAWETWQQTHQTPAWLAEKIQSWEAFKLRNSQPQQLSLFQEAQQ